jgi:succinate-acetate transporter protein
LIWRQLKGCNFALSVLKNYGVFWYKEYWIIAQLMLNNSIPPKGWGNVEGSVFYKQPKALLV